MRAKITQRKCDTEWHGLGSQESKKMKASTRKAIAQSQGEQVARAQQTTNPYPVSTARNPDKYELHFNWNLGYARALSIQANI